MRDAAMGRRYGFDDQRIEDTASRYAQERLAGVYYEERYLAEQRALRGYWGQALFAFGLLSVLILPGFLYGLVQWLRARRDARLSGMYGPGYTALWVVTWALPWAIPVGVLVYFAASGAPS